MNAKPVVRKTGSFSSALLLGVIFGVFLVLCRELAYQSRLQEQYKQYTQTASAPALTAAPTPEVTHVPIEPEPSLSPEVAETPVETQIPEEELDDTPAGYRYDEESGNVIIELGANELVIDFAALKLVNPEFTGWFLIPDTDISYPVVQGTDNAFYLNHIFDGTYGMVGTLFVDFRNVMLEDENTIIYGHNFHQYGSMFSKLLYYAKQDWYEEHPVMYYLTEEGGYTIEVFSVYEASTSDPVYTLSFSGTEDYETFLEHVIEKSAIETGVEVTAEDKLITLSTCSNRYSDGRFVVVGKVSAFE